jgi:hypothetical protein
MLLLYAFVIMATILLVSRLLVTIERGRPSQIAFHVIVSLEVIAAVVLVYFVMRSPASQPPPTPQKLAAAHGHRRHGAHVATPPPAPTFADDPLGATEAALGFQR